VETQKIRNGKNRVKIFVNFWVKMIGAQWYLKILSCWEIYAQWQRKNEMG
jgi:hypothetical protein